MITIVSGLPRSGTSLMMQMLAAGGMPILSDGERRADVDNPKGYLEWERIKQLPNDPGCIAESEGKAVKVISKLLLSLPPGHEYRIIFMERPMTEVLASQEQMLRHRGAADGPNAAAMARAFEKHLHEVNRWFKGKPDVRILRVHYHSVLHEPATVAERLVQFLGVPLKVEAMSQQMDRTLYRQRAGTR